MTREMYNAAPYATGNHVTGSDYKQVRGPSSMPAKKRLTVEYREMTSHDSDSRPPSTCTTASRPIEDPLPTGHSFTDDGRQVDDHTGMFHSPPCSQPGHGNRDSVPAVGGDVWVRTACGSSFSAANSDLDQRMSDLRANKEKVLGLIADILSSGATNEDKEQKLGDIISDLETVRRRLVEQKAAQFMVSHLIQNQRWKWVIFRDP